MTPAQILDRLTQIRTRSLGLVASISPALPEVRLAAQADADALGLAIEMLRERVVH